MQQKCKGKDRQAVVYALTFNIYVLTLTQFNVVVAQFTSKKLLVCLELCSRGKMQQCRKFGEFLLSNGEIKYGYLI